MYKENRLARRDDFQKVYRYGKSTANQQFVLYRLNKHGQTELRLGISVSKKVGNAVVRNRLRRLIKEIVRQHLEELAGGADIIVIARKPVLEMEFREMEKSLLHVMKRALLLKNEGHSRQRKE